MYSSGPRGKRILQECMNFGLLANCFYMVNFFQIIKIFDCISVTCFISFRYLFILIHCSNTSNWSISTWALSLRRILHPWWSSKIVHERNVRWYDCGGCKCIRKWNVWCLHNPVSSASIYWPCTWLFLLWLNENMTICLHNFQSTCHE